MAAGQKLLDDPAAARRLVPLAKTFGTPSTLKAALNLPDARAEKLGAFLQNLDEDGAERWARRAAAAVERPGREPHLFEVHLLCGQRRGDAAGATWIFRGDESRRRRGRDVNIPWRRVAGRGRAEVDPPNGRFPRRSRPRAARWPSGDGGKSTSPRPPTASSAFLWPRTACGCCGRLAKVLSKLRRPHLPGCPRTGRGGATAATWIFRVDESR